MGSAQDRTRHVTWHLQMTAASHRHLTTDSPDDRLAAELGDAVREGQLRLLYQPVFAAGDESLAAVEALVRWQHPTRGLLSPGEFIALAERSERIVEIGTWVIEQACAQIRRWQEAHPARLAVRVSVNVSARQLSRELPVTVAAALQRHGVDPSLLALEITESQLIERSEHSRELLEALNAMGVATVLDDFGTGYSSLGYLRDLPLDQLKLDRSFCADLGDDPRSAKIVAATIELARALGMTVVAEGIETAAQLEILRTLGCDFGQGFWYARPEAADSILVRMRAAYERDRGLAARGAQRVADAARHLGPPRPHPGHRRAGPSEPRVRGRPVPARGRAAMSRVITGALAAPAVAPREARVRQRRALGRLAGWLYLVGAVLSIPADLAVHAPSVTAVIALTLMGLVTGLACLAVPWGQIAGGWLHVPAALATVEITISTVVDGRHGGMLSSFYILVAVAVAYGFPGRRAIAAHVTLIAVAMAVAPLLAVTPPADAMPRAEVGIILLIIIAAVIVYLRERVEASAAEVRGLAHSDPLTEVGNHRLLHERLAYEMVRHHREQQPLAVLLLDLDRFKQVNERLGHSAGDDVLRRVARTLGDAVREQDTVARRGDDEFAVLAPATDADGAQRLAGRLRDRLRRVRFAAETIDATVGWAVYPVDGLTPQALLAEADARLLTGKERRLAA